MASSIRQLQVVLAVMTSCLVYGEQEVPFPKIDLNEWWGPKEMKNNQDTSIRPFTVQFNETMISNLRYRLLNHRPFTRPLNGIVFQYGFNSDVLENWMQYWAKDYPFKDRENFLNQFPHFKTNIQGLDIHFIRVRSEDTAHKKVVPLLLLHGWPGSVREFYETIPYFLAGSKDRGFAIEIIVASLPGFGFSDTAVRPGLGLDKAAVVFRNLMHRLGHKKFYIQGGDLGSILTNNMATFFPKEVLGYHANLIVTYNSFIAKALALGSFCPTAVLEPDVVNRIYPLTTRLSHFIEGSGYLHLQATRPDTVGVGVSDSPAGLAAYILEKVSVATRGSFITSPDGGLTVYYTHDQLIDNLMIYWAANCMTTSMRMYAETFNLRYYDLGLNQIKSPVPMCVVYAKNEILFLPPSLIKVKYPNFLNSTVLPDGGHFLALEKPEFFADNVLSAIDLFRSWHKANDVVSDEDGDGDGDEDEANMK